MSRVKVDFQNLNAPEKIQRAYSIVEALDGNVHFPAPTPTLEQVRGLIADLEDAHQDAQFGGRIRKWKMYVAERALETAIIGLAGYVQAASAGDEAMILTSGFELKSFTTASKPVAIPGVPLVKPGHLDGSIILRWTPVSGARSYFVRISHDNGETWEEAGHYTKSRVLITGLITGNRPWLQIAAFGTLGQSQWSEPGIGKVA